MINLLPPNIKTSYRYAERNVSLIRWAVAGLVVLLGVGLIITYGWLYMNQSISTYTEHVNAKQATLKKEKFAETEKRVQDISSNLKLVVQVLSKEVLFSELLKQIAVAIPANANLTDLNINQLQGGLDITANASDYDTATQVQVNLSNPDNKLFSKADIENISCSSSGSADPRYPCTVRIRTLFVPNNPFLFINNKGGGA